MKDGDVDFAKKNLALNFLSNEIMRIEIDLNSHLIVTATTFISNMILVSFFTTVTLLSSGYATWILAVITGTGVLALAGLKIINRLLKKKIKHYLEEHRKQYITNAEKHRKILGRRNTFTVELERLQLTKM
jgi:hypothetical protein